MGLASDRSVHAAMLGGVFLDRESDVSAEGERARRFDVHLALRYRSAGEARWCDGRIENISRSGILFWTEQPLAVDTPLEMTFVLPLGEMPPEIVCRGRVVRTVLPRGHQAPPGMAVSISAYRFVKGPVGRA